MPGNQITLCPTAAGMPGGGWRGRARFQIEEIREIASEIAVVRD
jgi:hypothetical protein